MKLSKLLIALALVSTPSWAVVSVIITDLTTSTQTNRPIKVPMTFKQGDIVNNPRPTVGGVAVTTWQSTVHTRWPDGSVQTALIAFFSTITGSGSITVDFVNSANPCSSGNAAACLAAGLDIAAMQAFNGSPGWNVQVEAVASTITKTFNARTILNACGSISTDPGSLGCRYWAVGPVLTSVILEDRDTTLAYDAGWACTAGCTYPYTSATWITDSVHKSLHPIFNVEFWAGTSFIEYRAISLENMKSTHFQDQAYALTIKTGAGLGTTAYTKAYFTHFGQNRWRKSFWNGSAPGSVKMDLNTAYMISTGVIPNFDLSYTPTAAADNTAWNATDKCEPNGIGWFNSNLGDPGGRGELALIPKWYVTVLYTWDATAVSNIQKQSDCFGSAQINVRETQTGLFFDSAHTVSAFGRPYSVDAHPSNRIRDLVAVGSYTTGQTGFVNWQTAHEGDYSFVPYLISGDWYTLESMQLQLAADIQDTDPTTQAYGRNASMGLINGRAQQLRGQAWGFRDLIEATFSSVDSSAEKNYFTQKLNNNIGAWEGWYNITNGQYNGTAAWLFGRNVEAVADPNPLRFPQWPDQSAQFFNWINATVQWVESPLEFHFLTVALGHMIDMGYPFTKVQQVFAAVPINTVLNPAFNPWLIGAYRIPEFMNANQFHFATTWATVLSGYATSPTNYQTIAGWPVSDQTDCVSGFTHYALAATAYLSGVTLLSADGGYNGQNAYNWVSDPSRGVSNAACLATNPMWAFLPRGTVAPGGAATYYVSTTGNDSNPGTLASPKLTVSAGVALAVNPDDQVIVMDGTYTNEGVVGTGNFVVTLAHSGTSGHNIVIRAQNRGGAILDSVNTSTNTTCNGAAAYLDLANVSFVTIQGFVITRGCDFGIESNGTAHDILIKWNEIKNIANRQVTDTTGRDGIYLNSSESNFTFDGNIWHNIGRTSGQTLLHFDHGIYAQATGVTIINNLFYNMNAGYSIQIADQATNWTIAGNTFAFPNATPAEAGQIMLWNTDTNITIRDNIFYQPTSSALMRFTATLSGVFVDHNLIYPATTVMDGGVTTGMTIGTNQLGVNPLLVNPSATPPNMQLQAASPAVQAGVAVSGMTTDLLAVARTNPPDLGAYQHSTCAIVASTPPSGIVGTFYGPVTINSSLCGSNPLTWTVTAGALPPGLLGCQNAPGTSCNISGTPTTATGSPFAFTVRVSDGGANLATASYSISITQPGTGPVFVTSSPLPAGQLNVLYSQALVVTGSTPITYAVTLGALPTGLSINSTTGVISGIPTMAETQTFTIRATNSVASNSRVFTLIINGSITVSGSVVIATNKGQIQ